MSLKDLVMAIVAKPYQAFPLFAPGVVNCGCSGVDPCLHFLTTDTLSFQVGLTAGGDACNCSTQDWVERGDMSPLLTGFTSTSGATLTDLSKDFSAAGVQAGSSCGYIVKNTTLGTYSYVTVVVTASELTLNAAIFTAVGQAYEIYPWSDGASGSWTFQSGTARASVTNPLRQCNLRIPSCSPSFQDLLDNRYYVLSMDVEQLAAVQIVATMGGQVQSITNTDGIPVGTVMLGYEPQFWTNQNLTITFLGVLELDNVSLKAHSTIGIRIYDCDGVEVLEDSTNAHGWVTYATGSIESPRAQVDIIWSETGLEDGCYQVCLYDLCGDTDGCILESYSVKLTSTGYNYNYNEDSDACELKIEWTNHDDFEIEQGDFLNYPEYPGVAGYQSYVQLLRTFGKVRFTGFVAGDYTLNQESDGLREVVHYEGHETYELQIESLPEPLHRALAKGLAHDSFVVDGVQYVWADGEYQPAWKKSTDSASVVVRLIKQYSKGENINAAD